MHMEKVFRTSENSDAIRIPVFILPFLVSLDNKVDFLLRPQDLVPWPQARTQQAGTGLQPSGPCGLAVLPGLQPGKDMKGRGRF